MIFKQVRQIFFKNEGQSILEFALMLPFFLSLCMIMVWSNSAIQTSIVNQQYARAATLFFAFNSPYYPEVSTQATLMKNRNAIISGVTSKNIGASDTSVLALAPVQALLPAGTKSIGNNAANQEPLLRGKVRIRNTVTLCTQTFYPSATGPNLLGVFQENDWPPSYICGGQNQ